MPCDAAQPYPRKRPYPNPLDGSDYAADYDRDSLHSIEEYSAWARHPGHSLSALWYSGGLKSSIDSDPSDGCLGMTAPAFQVPPAFGYTLPSGYSLQLDGLACLRDDERDEDGDLLNNYTEAHGPLLGDDWWNGVYQESAYSADLANPKYKGTDWLTADSDNDGYIDGLDDQDFDGFLNIEELVRGRKSETLGVSTGVATGLWVQPFDPIVSPTPPHTAARRTRRSVRAGHP